MADGPKLSHTSALILHTLDSGHVYGYSLMEATGLPSGTIYPALRRLEREELVRSAWERTSAGAAVLRPPRKYYKLTRAGSVALREVRNRYPLLAKLAEAQAK